MSEDRALYGGSIAIGLALIVAQLSDGGPLGTGATIGMCMVLLGIRGLRSIYKLPSARVVRSR
jgi:hypothetical protein